jgi:CubicO group peptidase (beta-lactamase class C family)
MMKRIFRIFAKILGSLVLLLGFLIGIFFLVKPNPPEVPEDAYTLVDVEAYIEDLVNYGIPPGISILVVKDNEVVYGEAFGVADGLAGIPAAPETVYRCWSITKIFTATAVLQLYEQNLLDIDDPVTHYLPFFDVIYPSEDSAKITIRHLLNHSSGISNNVPAVLGWMATDPKDELRSDQAAFLESVLPDYAKLAFEPGTQARYTNVGYMILGAIIEEVSGQPYQEYILEHIFQPLGMSQTNFIYTDEMLKNAAVGSHPTVSWEMAVLPFLLDDWDNFVLEKVDGRVWFNRMYPYTDPPTGMISTTPDLSRFLMMYLNSGEFDGVRILSPDTVYLMTNDQPIANTSQGETRPFSGLGWGVFPNDGRVYLAHDGGGPGFGAEIRIYPEESLAMVVIANDTTYDAEGILDLFAALDW